MFIIIGGDGKEYGPVTAEQIRAWIAAGRANLDTKAKAQGTDEWRRLADFAEFYAPDTLPPVMPAGPAGSVVMETRAAVVDATPLAGFGARIGAALVNALLYFTCMLPGAVATMRQIMADNPELAEGHMPSPESLQLATAMEYSEWVRIGLFAAILLQCVLIAWRGQNLGKLLTGARVVRADNGERASFLRAGVLRFIVPVSLIFLLNWLPPLGFLFLFVDFCFMFREDRRCLHDLMAGTKVVRA